MLKRFDRTLVSAVLTLSLLSGTSFASAHAQTYPACTQLHPEDYAPKAKLRLKRHAKAHYEVPCRLDSGAVVMSLLEFSYDKAGQLSIAQTLVADTGLRHHLKGFWTTTLGRLSMLAGVLGVIYYLRKGHGLRRGTFRSQADEPAYLKLADLKLADAASDLRVGDELFGEQIHLLVVGYNEAILL